MVDTSAASRKLCSPVGVADGVTHLADQHPAGRMPASTSATLERGRAMGRCRRPSRHVRGRLSRSNPGDCGRALSAQATLKLLQFAPRHVID
jgi:hypothetical protein